MAKRNSITGILNLDKPVGITSHDVLIQVRRLSGEKKAGHCGTLDPMAGGVLLVCLGQATRAARFLSSERKQYRATVRLGWESDTLDKTGRIISRREPRGLTREQLEQALADFRGPIQQIPPMFSAIKKDGQPLYKLARQGLSIQRPPRQVHIYALELLEFDPPYFSLHIECSAGTYIRSLAADIGKKLGCGALLWRLTRTACGRFQLKDSLSLEQLAQLASSKRLAQAVIDLNQALAHLPPALLKQEALEPLRNGSPLKQALVRELPPGLSKGQFLRLLSPGGQLLAIAQTLVSCNGLHNRLPPERLLLQPRLVFHSSPCP